MNSILAIRKLVAHNSFQHAVISLIVLNAILLGLETSPAIMNHYGDFLLSVNVLLQAAFVLEIILRLLSYFPKPGEFFRNGWNIFDLCVIVFSLLPLSGAFAGVARLARVLRVVRIISVSPNLRLIIER
jgi:voltage-gated sodium channel